MKIIKRNGSEVEFDISKIENAITAANAEVPAAQRLTDRQISYASRTSPTPAPKRAMPSPSRKSRTSSKTRS